MNIAYSKLATGEWFVEAWMYTSDLEMVHTSCIDSGRGKASWGAFDSLAGKMGMKVRIGGFWPFR